MARRSERGQSIVEYLILAMVIVTAILIAKPLMVQAINSLYGAATGRVQGAATTLTNM